MSSDALSRPLSVLLMAAGAVICGWLAFTASARADDRDSIFMTAERTIDGVVYEVKVRKDAPEFSTDASGYAF